MPRVITFAQRMSTSVTFFMSRKKGRRSIIKLLSVTDSVAKPKKRYKVSRHFCERTPGSQFASRSYYQIGATYFLQGQFERSVQFLNEALPRITDARQHAEAEQLIGLSYLKQKRWAEASEVFKMSQASDVIQVREKAGRYHNYAEKGAALPTRSPFLAGAFSTIVPGTGRLYTGRFSDALTTLFTVGITGWQAYDGFRRDGLSSAKGWTLGTLCGIFYVGNIYGSVISARVYNRHITDEFLATLSIELPY